MYRRPLALALAVLMLLTASTALAPVPSHAGPAPATTSSGAEPANSPAAPPVITFELLNGFDTATTTFLPGEIGAGTLYFEVTDPLDHDVNVTLTDPNAADDGTGTPAFHYEAALNTTTSTYNSYPTGVSYTFPVALPYGGEWVVTFSAPNGGTVSEDIAVLVYSVTLSSSIGGGSTIPGQPLTVFWSLERDANDELYTRATNVTITGRYTGNGTVQPFFSKANLALTPASAGTGQWSGVVPANATPGTLLRFEVYAITNLSGVVTENASNNITVAVGALSIRDYGITPAPPTCSFAKDEFFPNGSQVAGCVEVGALYRAAFTPIPGLPVTVGYWNGTAHVTPTGAPTTLTTNASGEAAFTFFASAPPFVEVNHYPRFDGLNFTVTVAGASSRYAWTQWQNATWTLNGGSTASGVVQVSLNGTEYYAGNSATATWSINSSNLSKTGPIVAIGWSVTGPDAVTYEEGTLNSSAQTGTVVFAITSPMVSHTIELTVDAANATEGFSGSATAAVLNPSLLLTPASTYFSAGSRTTVTAVLNGGGTGAKIQYEVIGNWPSQTAAISNGTVLNDSGIPIVVPATTPPQSIAVDAWATVNGQVIATDSVDLFLAVGYSLQLWVSTPSSYSDGSYQPGETVTLSYQLVAVGGATLPKVVTFALIALDYPATDEIQGVAPSGSVSFTIPSNAVEGTLLLELAAEGIPSGSCLPSGTCTSIAALYINPHPSFLNFEIGAASGVTVGWLLLLVLGIVVTAVLLLLLRRRGGRRAGDSGSTSSVPEWKEPAKGPSTETSSGGSAPPSGPS